MFPTPVCIRTHKNDHVSTLNIQWSMSELGRLRKTRKDPACTCLVGLGGAVAVRISRKGLIKCKRKEKIHTIASVAMIAKFGSCDVPNQNQNQNHQGNNYKPDSKQDCGKLVSFTICLNFLPDPWPWPCDLLVVLYMCHLPQDL